MQSGQKISLDLNALRRDVFLKAVQFVAGRLASEEQSGGSELLSTKAPSNISEAKDRGCLILVAEDNENNRKVLRQQLRICGYNAQMANNGREALDLWRSGCYSLLLTDCHMPEMDGYTLTRTIRSEEAGQKRIPIIAITADALQGTRELCLSSGMDDYVSKPMQLNLLREKLTQWLPSQKPLPVQPSGKSSENRLNAQQGVLSYPPASVDPEALKAALGSDDPQMLKEFYGDFVNFANHTITTLQQAYNASQATEISQLAHRLKSSARTVGANHLADCCLALEQAGKSTNWQLLKKNMQQLPQLFSEARQWILQFTESRVE
jgi:CheY-like chemotaxis protein/HPt (histidine-containing phosphotransfer) domain-containing protein